MPWASGESQGQVHLEQTGPLALRMSWAGHSLVGTAIS